MAAYGALVSVMQILDQLHNHPHPPISLDKTQSQSLAANVTFLQKFLEGYNPHVRYTEEADPLQSRIAEAAYAAEDVIESYIVDQINLARSTDHVEEISSIEFSQGLQKVIEEMDLIKMEAMEMKDKKKMGVQIIKKSTTDAAIPSRSSSTAQKVAMVGLDDVLYEMLDKITGGERARQIIPIVGMGGLGKTTLARNIYANPLVKEHFDYCAWSTISQVHNARKILSEILDQVAGDDGGDLSESDLGVKLYQHLIGKKYMIVMDDMWSIEAWDVVRSFFPEDKNGSRVVVTTRLSNLASKFNYSNGLDMKFLDEDSCWKLFCKTVFGEEICPSELEGIGKKIVEGCRGLPLSIAVAGGLLSKSEPTRQNWELIEENLSSVVNLEDDASCLQILYTSYNNLPVYIKPCFLYLGLSNEDEVISLEIQIPQWVAEGFIGPHDGKSMEEVAEEYIEELIDRNLILVEKRNDCGDVKAFKVHDLVRDLAMKEANKDRFSCSLMGRSSDGRKFSLGMISTYRRIASSFDEEYPLNEFPGCVEATTKLSLVRTLMGKFSKETLPLPCFRLLRLYMGRAEGSREEMFIRIPNLRFLVVNIDNTPLLRIPSYLWNLQTVIMFGNQNEKYCALPIWKMPQLRLVMIENALYLPNLPIGGEEVVLENLHTLLKVMNLTFSEELLKRISNVRKLKLYYCEKDDEEEKKHDYCLNNLHRLNKLQELHLNMEIWISLPSMQELTLPYSLKQLTLEGTMLPWEEMASKIGCLPLLQVLKLKYDAFIGNEWETIEGQFRALKFLKFLYCDHLERWITDDCTHFPRLEHLVLIGLKSLDEIPSCIGDIPTLRSIKLFSCSVSVHNSAERIREEQEEYGNELLQIQVDGQPI